MLRFFLYLNISVVYLYNKINDWNFNTDNASWKIEERVFVKEPRRDLPQLSNVWVQKLHWMWRPVCEEADQPACSWFKFDPSLDDKQVRSGYYTTSEPTNRNVLGNELLQVFDTFLLSAKLGNLFFGVDPSDCPLPCKTFSTEVKYFYQLDEHLGISLSFLSTVEVVNFILFCVGNIWQTCVILDNFYNIW